MEINSKDTFRTGSPFKGICLFGIPLFLSSLVGIVYSWVDGILLGKGNADAFTAIAMSTYLIFFGTTFASGFANGTTVHSSELYGKGDIEGVKKDIASSLILMGMFDIVLSMVLVALVNPLITWSGCPDGAVADELRTYLYFTFGIYMSFLFFSTHIGSLFRAVGDSKPGFYISIISSLVNILFDFIFLFLLHYGTLGVAIGTIGTSAISYIVSLIIFKKRHQDIIPKKNDFRLNKDSIRATLHNALPNGLQSTFIGVALFLYQRSINSFGVDAINGYGVSAKVLNLALIVVGVFTSSSLVFVSVNKGANDQPRINKGLKQVGIFLFVYCLASGFLFFFLRKYLCSWFLKGDEATSASPYCEAFALYMPLTLLLDSFLSYSRYILLGYEKAWWSFASCILEALLRIIFTLFVVPSLGFMGLVYCDILCFSGALIITIVGIKLSFQKPKEIAK
jgi:Na+-driven multidrug efflux pump